MSMQSLDFDQMATDIIDQLQSLQLDPLSTWTTELCLDAEYEEVPRASEEHVHTYTQRGIVYEHEGRFYCRVDVWSLTWKEDREDWVESGGDGRVEADFATLEEAEIFCKDTSDLQFPDNDPGPDETIEDDADPGFYHITSWEDDEKGRCYTLSRSPTGKGTEIGEDLNHGGTCITTLEGLYDFVLELYDMGAFTTAVRDDLSREILHKALNGPGMPDADFATRLWNQLAAIGVTLRTIPQWTGTMEGEA